MIPERKKIFNYLALSFYNSSNNPIHEEYNTDKTTAEYILSEIECIFEKKNIYFKHSSTSLYDVDKKIGIEESLTFEGYENLAECNSIKDKLELKKINYESGLARIMVSDENGKVYEHYFNIYKKEEEDGRLYEKGIPDYRKDIEFFLQEIELTKFLKDKKNHS